MQQAAFTQDDTDGGKPKAARERTCIVTREQKPVAELIRFVLSPERALTPDLKASLPGRGVWVTAKRALIEQAIKRNSFAQGLKADVKADAGLPEQVGQLLKTRALSAISFANKAGELVAGAAKVHEALEKRALALLHASDGAEDGIAKLDRLFHAISGPQAPIFGFFSSKDLDMALGRANVIHAALNEGHAARACLHALQAYAAYEGFE